jgi:hypothetical protein
MGAETAMGFTNRHEAGPYPDTELKQLKRQMDLANNYYGRQLAAFLGPVSYDDIDDWREWTDRLVRKATEFINQGGACTLRPKRRPDGLIGFTDGFVDGGRCGLT